MPKLAWMGGEDGMGPDDVALLGSMKEVSAGADFRALSGTASVCMKLVAVSGVARNRPLAVSPKGLGGVAACQ
ncbi:hypothetical protein Q5762_38505, partial [Streptomyces sp. P9(2023)]|uniref:hypothetical protein n=1 Tax=Streptomyces sp. P9(2023) TaxID=3064394 RepID=UPI0028F445BB